MKDNIKTGAEIHAGDGGYSLGTQEKYEEFVKLRSGTMTAMEKMMYDSGLTAQGCWDQMDSYDKDAIMKFAELIVKEYEKLLPEVCPWVDADKEGPMKGWHVQFVARKHFGVEE